MRGKTMKCTSLVAMKKSAVFFCLGGFASLTFAACLVGNPCPRFDSTVSLVNAAGKATRRDCTKAPPRNEAPSPSCGSPKDKGYAWTAEFSTAFATMQEAYGNNPTSAETVRAFHNLAKVINQVSNFRQFTVAKVTMKPLSLDKAAMAAALQEAKLLHRELKLAGAQDRYFCITTPALKGGCIRS
jgi:hypothetical protein